MGLAQWRVGLGPLAAKVRHAGEPTMGIFPPPVVAAQITDSRAKTRKGMYLFGSTWVTKTVLSSQKAAQASGAHAASR